MTAITNDLTLGDLLKYEEENLYSRNQVTVVSGQNLKLGTVIGRVSATQKVKALDPSATDGSQVAAGVVLQSIDASAAEKTNGLIVSRQAIVADHALVWPVAITTEEKTAAIAQLEAIGVLVRQGV
ncbi:head decoration protein [Limnohabitans sp. MMS-10A-160]|uniref:head decoration protein n=1 Tax=Limnohabitans sp. MMS-10A-160 TaxID=1835766 RepID=UPI000D39D046|nr:head decoration protein [Limnohabitans sp. MMS-10A-160]PUE22931.1 head decoration protein [Limnohabitans sp. MMS-10A-160]